MKPKLTRLLAAGLVLWSAASGADDSTDTVALFKSAGESASFFSH